MTPRPKRVDAPITPVIVRSLEPIDLEAWLDQYARAIVEAQAPPSSQPSPSHSRLAS